MARSVARRPGTTGIVRMVAVPYLTLDPVIESYRRIKAGGRRVGIRTNIVVVGVASGSRFARLLVTGQSWSSSSGWKPRRQSQQSRL